MILEVLLNHTIDACFQFSSIGSNSGTIFVRQEHMAMKRTLLNMVSVIHLKNVIVVVDLTRQIVRRDTERAVCVSNLYKCMGNSV